MQVKTKLGVDLESDTPADVEAGLVLHTVSWCLDEIGEYLNSLESGILFQAEMDFNWIEAVFGCVGSRSIESILPRVLMPGIDWYCHGDSLCRESL